MYIISTFDLNLWLTDDFTDSYADDTHNTISCNDELEVKEKIERYSKEVSLFMSSNGLKMNSNKTEVLVVRPHKSTNNLSFKIGSDIVSEKSEMSVLGIKICGDLKWHQYITELKGDLTKKVGLLYRLRNKLSTQNLVTIADGILMSKMRYCLSSYGSV